MKNKLNTLKSIVLVTAFILSSVSIIGQTTSVLSITDNITSKNQSLPAITFYSFDAFFPPLNNTIDNMVADFNANYSASYGFKVNLAGDTPGQPTDTHDIFLTSFQSKSTRYDVYTMYVPWSIEFGSAGYLLPLNNLFNSSYRAQFFQSDIAAGTYNGQLYAVPWIHDSGMLYYRSDILHYAFANGIIPADRPPQAWSELSNWTLAMLHNQPLVAKFNLTSGFVWQGESYPGLIYDFMEYLGATGTYSFLSANQPTPVFENTTGLQDALRYMKSLINSGVSPRAILTYDEEASRAVWNAGNAIFMRNWPYAYSLSLNSAQLNGSLVSGPEHNVQQFNVTAMPAENLSVVNPRTSCLGGQQLAVNAYSKHPTDAKKFIMWLTASKQQQTYFLGTGHLPALKTVYNSPAVLQSKEPYIRQYLPIFESSIPEPVTSDYQQISKVLPPVINNYLGGNMSLETAINNMTASVKSISNQSTLSGSSDNNLVYLVGVLVIGLIVCIAVILYYPEYKKRGLK